MKEYIVYRALDVAELIVKDDLTIREVAKKLNCSKSTVHKDIERLWSINNVKYGMVREIMDRHLEERPDRGGEATRQKYLKIRENKMIRA